VCWQTTSGAADAYTGRRSDGTFSSVTDAYYAIQCLDGSTLGRKTSERIKALREMEARTAQAAPRLGASNAGSYAPCATTLAPVRPAPLPVGKDAPPILVVNSTGDPATPLASAQALARELRSAVLVTTSGEAHGLLGLNACSLELAVRYLVDLQVPQDGTARARNEGGMGAGGH